MDINTGEIYEVTGEEHLKQLESELNTKLVPLTKKKASGQPTSILSLKIFFGFIQLFGRRSSFQQALNYRNRSSSTVFIFLMSKKLANQSAILLNLKSSWKNSALTAPDI